MMILVAVTAHQPLTMNIRMFLVVMSTMATMEWIIYSDLLHLGGVTRGYITS
jgi:hypothetical protein